MRIQLVFRLLLLAASPAMSQTVVPGSPLLRADRIHPYTDSITLVTIPRDSARQMLGTLVRRVEVVRERGVVMFRETQQYDFAAGGTEVDTLDVSATTLEPMRVVETDISSGHALRFHDGRLTGIHWSPDSGRRDVDIPLGAAFFHAMMTEAFLGAFPLAPDSTLRLPVAETPDVQVRMAKFHVTGTATLRTADGSVQCLVVHESATTIAWVSRADGHLVRLHWTLPNGTGVWKLPTRDVPFLNARDLSAASRSAGTGGVAR